MSLTIGVDVGGTKIAAGVVDDDGHIVAQLRRETPSTDPVALVDTVAGLASELALAHDVRAIGIGAPGFIDETRSIVRFAPNLAWREEPVGEAVRKRTNLPVVVENDANSAAWAEARFGAGRDQSDVVMLTIGSGVGGGIVIGNRLFRGRFGIGAEIGHTNAVPDGRRCGCGNRGCYEQYASGRALVHEARELASSSPALAGRLLELGGGTPEGIEGEEVTLAAQEGNAAARECFDIVGHYLGQLMADLAAVLDPGCFVLGGGVSEAGDLLLLPARHAFQASLTGRGHRPVAEVRIAHLGGEAGVVGAADLARQH